MMMKKSGNISQNKDNSRKTLNNAGEKYHKLLSTANDAIFIAESETGIIIDANRQAEILLDKPLTKIIGIHQSELHPKEEAERYSNIFKKSLTSGHGITEELFVVNSSGKKIPVEISANVTKINGKQVIQGIFRDLSKRNRNTELMRYFATDISTEAGDTFFKSLATFLAETLNADYAFIGKLSDKDHNKVQTLALYALGQIVENFEYNLTNTPCKQVVGKQLCFYPDKVQQQFPEDTLLVDMGVQSYIGAPLFDSQKGPIGLLVAMDRKPMQDNRLRRFLFRQSAVRAAYEIERMRAEKILSEELDTAQNYLNSSAQIFVVLDTKHNVNLINRQGCQLLGFKEEEIVGQNWFKFIPERSKNTQLRAIRNLTDDNFQSDSSFEHPVLLKNGSERIISWHNTLSRDDDGTIIGTICSGQDITERASMESELRQSREKFSSFFYYSNDSIFIHDNDGNILDANQRALDQFEYSRLDILTLRIFDMQPAKFIKSARNKYNTLINKGYANFETAFMKKNGTWFSADVSASLFEIDDMKVIQSRIRDISDRKKTEQELLRYHERLEELIKENTDELLKANEYLEKEIKVRKKAEKKLLVHQKQLQSVASQMSLIEEREKRHIASELHDCVGQTLALAKIKLGLLNKLSTSEEMKNNVKEILQLIEQTITETRTLTFELSPPILYELGFDQAIKWLIDQFRQKHNIDVTLLNDGSIKPFDSNISFFLFQAVRELLVNIAKHSQTDRAKIAFTRCNNKLKISVTDKGIGFSDTSTVNSGYGLFNIRERMNHINGKFKIKSVPDHGTQVTLLAPFKLTK